MLFFYQVNEAEDLWDGDSVTLAIRSYKPEKRISVT
jgi:hypothetical protein